MSSIDKSDQDTRARHPVIPVMQSEYLALTVARACGQGADRDAILNGCLLRPEIVDEPSQPVPSASVYLASTRAAALSGNPCLCAEIAREHDWRAGFEPPGTLGATPSLGDLLLAWLHFVDRVQVSMRYQLTIDATRARLTGRRLLKASQPTGQADAWDMTAWILLLQSQLGPTWNKNRVEIRVFDPRAIPADMIPMDRVRGSDAWGLGLSFPSEWLMQQTAFEGTPAISGQATDQTPLDLPRLFEVFDYSAWPGLDGVARFVGVHPKALQRELARRGTSGARLADGARKRLAARWLAEGTLSLKSIGRNLGYNNASAFTRACHRWFGCSPQQWRLR